MSHSPNALLIQQFIDRAVSLGAVVERCNGLESAKKFIAAFCQDKTINTIAATAQAQAMLGNGGKIKFSATKTIKDFDCAELGIVDADYGIAETGTLVSLQNNDFEKLAGILPKICLALVQGKRIVESAEAIAPVINEHLSGNTKPAPQVSFVSGPSRTADIECQLCIGVHGPASLIILLIDEA